MQIKPADRIVVLKPITLPEIEGKLMALENKEPKLGEIIDWGATGYFETGQPKPFPLQFQKGDIVAYREFGQYKFYIDGEEKIFVNFDDCLAILEKEKKKNG